jgi:ABC-type phosphate transport system substrate-binding protein
MKKILLPLMCLGLLLMGRLLFAQDISFKIVVNASNSISSMTGDEVSELFLKKVTKWQDGQKVLPVDLPDTSSIRQDFSEEVHGKKIQAVKAYWQRKIFSGRGVPPSQRSSDREVLLYVQEHVGAIGYVSASATESEYKVKVLNLKN